MSKPLSEIVDEGEGNRDWYRRRSDHQLGYLVMRSGQQCIRLDRGSQEIVVPYRPGEWVHAKDERPFTKAQVAMMIFEWDRALCRSLGLVEEARRDWRQLRETERGVWIEGIGPDKPKIRAIMFKAIWEAMSPYFR